MACGAPKPNPAPITDMPRICLLICSEALWNDPVPTEPLDAGTALHYRNYSDWYTTMANDHSTPPNLSGDDDWCGENGDCDPRKWYANSFYTNTARKVGKFYSQRALRAFCYYNQLVHNQASCRVVVSLFGTDCTDAYRMVWCEHTNFKRTCMKQV